MKRWFLVFAVFLLLMLGLSSGSAYMAFNAASKGVIRNDDQKMAVALVNEDEGGSFNGKKYAFGNEFVKNIEKDNSQDWYVVSRGVAESGLNTNTYNMMIVIPNDFTEKALSITSSTPENVVLDYKVNASGSTGLKTKAEKTANSILENFNRRIIDVYFASILGNLHDAQDNVTTLIKKEQDHTNYYINRVHAPLSGYTNQFSSVQEESKLSKNAFKGFQDLIKGNGSLLAESEKEGDAYQTGLLDYVKMKNANEMLSSSFADQLQAFHDNLNNEAIQQQLDTLLLANQAVNAQFQARADQDGNILAQSGSIQTYLASTKGAIQELQTDLTAKLNTDLEQSIAAQLQKEMSGADQKVALDQFFKNPDEAIRQRIQKQISRLPSLELREIENADLDDSVSAQMKNVIAVSKQYGNEFGYDPEPKDDQLPIVEQVNQIKQDLTDSGLTLTDKVEELPRSKKPGQIFTLSIPKAFSLEKLTLILPDGEEKKLEDNQIVLPATEKGAFTVKADVKLKDDALDEVKLFEPVKWSWQIEQKDAENDGKAKNAGGQTANSGKPDSSETAADRGTGTKADPDNASNLEVTRTASKVSAGQRSIKAAAEENSTAAVPNGDPDAQSRNAGTSGNSGNADNGNAGISDDNGNTDNSGNAGINGDANTDNSGSTGTNADGNADNSGNTGTNDGNGNADNSGNTDTNGNDGKTDNNGNAGTNGDGNADNDGNAGTSDDNGNTDHTGGSNTGTQTPEPVKVVNNTISHQVMTKLTDDPSGKLMQALNDTIKDYQKTAMLYELYFGKDVSVLADDSTGSLKDAASKDSLYYLFNQQNIADVLAGYIAGYITNDVRGQTENLKNKIDSYLQLVQETQTHADGMAAQIQNTIAQADTLNAGVAETLKNLDAWRKASLELQDGNGKIAASQSEEGSKVMALGDQFKSLLATSQALKEESASNLHSADTVYTTFDEIDKQANEIKASGQTLVKHANTLSGNLANKLANDQKFAKNFAGVLANSRVGNRPNEDLLNFLSNPVQTKNSGLITAKNSFVPYYLVLICFIAALFTAYVISSYERKRKADDTFEEERALPFANMPITLVIAGVGLAEGILIGLISDSYLHIARDQALSWVGWITLITFTLLSSATYLLRQLRMAGMFLLLMVFSMYLFLTDALGNHFDPDSAAGTLQKLSPLQYIQNLLSGFDSNTVNTAQYLVVLLAISILAVIGHLFVLNRFTKAGKVDEEDVHEVL